MSNVKTINLTGGETEVKFGQKFMCFWVQNLGSGNVYASVKAGVVPEADGVITVGAGASARVSMADMPMSQIDTLYLSGSGKVQIAGTYSVHCPFKTETKGGGSGGIGGLITLGDAAYFDAASIDIENKVWRNILNPVSSASIASASEVSVSVEGNEVIFPVDDYAVYKTETLATIYVVYKMLDSDGKVVIGKGTSTDIRGSGFDIWSSATSANNRISLLTNVYNVYSDVVSTDDFHTACIVRRLGKAQLLRADLYVDGVYYGSTDGDMTENYYTGNFYINTVFRAGRKYDDGHNAYKAVVFDTFPHPEEIILQNMKYLKNKYL